MKQALAFLAIVAAITGCTGTAAASGWGEGGPERRQRRSPVLQGDVFLERSSSSLATVELWSRVHNAEALAETRRQVLVAQQEALQALQKEQEALAVREAKTEAIVQGKPVQWSSAAPPKTPETAYSKIGSSRTQTHRITHGVELVVNNEHSGHSPGIFSSLRTRLASLWGRRASRSSAAHRGHSASARNIGNAEDKRQNRILFLAKKNLRKQQESGTKRAKEHKKKLEYSDRFWYQLYALGFCVAQALLIGLIYEQCCQKAYPKLPESAIKEEEWQFGLFQWKGCARDWRICLFAFCCPGARWADTVSRLQPPVMGFLPALFIFSLLEGASWLTYSASAVILFLVVVLSRLRIREAYGISSGEFGIFNDCFVYCCCAPCAIAQEARQIEYVTLPEAVDY
mmetsp:Transcript_3574/g.6342  ORF Transcript_3574/g.6342 Transcript_3574/m.6342 type:complete len:400 (-) Transcript_3574:100-1299(-)